MATQGCVVPSVIALLSSDAAETAREDLVKNCEQLEIIYGSATVGNFC